MLKGAIFDFDGTLFDSMFIWDKAGEMYLQSVGIKAEDNLQKILKPLTLRQSAVYFKEKYQLQMSPEEIMAGINHTIEEFYFYTVQPKAGVIPLLEEMKSKGIKMCIATATDRYQVERALKRCDMEKFFSDIFTCNDIGCGKDEPYIFRRAMESLGTDRNNTVVVEDAFHALKTAKADGFITVAIYDSSENMQKDIAEIADVYLSDYFDLNNFWKLACKI